MANMINKNVLALFLQDNKEVMKPDEVVVYAKAFEFYNNEYEGYSTLNRVITINERNGIVTKWMLDGTEALGYVWFHQNAK